MADRAAKRALFDEFARVGKALGSGRRIELLDVLANGERSVEALAGEVGLSAANASQHLQLLRQAGLVASRREGTSVYYRLASPMVFELWRALRTLAATHLAEVERLAAVYLGVRDELEPMSRAELARRLQDGEGLVVLDVRPAAEHTAGHVPGAVSIPLAELRRRLTGAAARPRDRRLLPRPVVRLRPRGGRAAAPGGMAGAAAGGRAAGVGGGRPAGRASIKRTHRAAEHARRARPVNEGLCNSAYQ